MKTSDEILLFLVKNSIPEYYIFPIEAIEAIKVFHDPPKEK